MKSQYRDGDKVQDNYDIPSRAIASRSRSSSGTE